jgi:hypothetical protein
MRYLAAKVVNGWLDRRGRGIGSCVMPIWS